VGLRLDADAWRARPGVARLLDVLGAAEGLTRYVGGAVRDELMGLASSDIDLATRLDPLEVKRRLEASGIKAVPTGIEHGTITAISDGQVVEVTTLRRDVSTDGRRATVAFTDDWREDAARRDFTINALFADPLSGEIFDYFGGLDDVLARRVRFIGDPLQRIAEDHLRILRFFRFHARFGASAADPHALDACTVRANDLMALSRERIADELLKLLGLSNPAPTVEMMLERSILRPVLPEIQPGALPRLRALIAAESDAAIAPHGLRRLAALLPQDPTIAENVAARLKLSNRDRKRLAFAARPDVPADPRERAYRFGIGGALDTLLLEGRSSEASSLADWEPPRLAVGGGELIGMGVPKGPDVARRLREIEDAWIAAGFPGGEEFDRLAQAVLGASKTG
jgi:poly(A) polymerase